MNGVAGDADVGVAVIRQYRIAAVSVAGAARKVAAGHVDLDPVAGADSVTDVAEVDGQPLHAIRHKMVRLAGGGAVHGADHTVHQQHGAPVGVKVDQLGDKVGIGAVRLYGKGHPHLAGNGEVFGE